MAQTPAERVRARIKALLDKTTTVKDSKDEKVESYVPTPSQRELMEADSFEATSFLSHRAPQKVVYIIHVAAAVVVIVVCCCGVYPDVLTVANTIDNLKVLLLYTRAHAGGSHR